MRNIKLIQSLVIVSLLSVLTACGGGSDATYLEVPGDGADIDITAPRIVSQSPSVDSSASVDVVVAVAFDEEIDLASVNNESILVNGPDGEVSGTVSYDSNLKQISFVPDSYLVAFTTYQVQLFGITDVNGNLVEQSQNWNFETIFDQLPPELPEF